MTHSPAGSPDTASRYLISLDKASIPEKQKRWYVKRLEEFIKAQNGHKIKSLIADDVSLRKLPFGA